MTDKPQQPKHDDRVEGRSEPRAVASAAFDNGLTLPSSNDTLKRKMMAKQQKLDAAARELLAPVKHTIKVEALK